MNDSAQQSKHVVLGVITAPHGVRGQVKIKSFTSDPADLTAYGELSDGKGTVYALRVKGEAKGLLIAQIDGVNDRNAAERLRGTELGVDASRLPEPDEDEYYIEDLIGLVVTQANGETYGRVTAVHNFGAGDIIEIERASDNKREQLLFNHDTFPTIDLTAGTITITPPEYILAKDSERNEESHA